MPPTQRGHANTKPRVVIHTSPAISKKAIFNRSLTTLHFCAWVSLRRTAADDLTFSQGNMTLQPIQFHPTLQRGQMLLIFAFNFQMVKIIAGLLIMEQYHTVLQLRQLGGFHLHIKKVTLIVNTSKNQQTGTEKEKPATTA